MLVKANNKTSGEQVWIYPPEDIVLVYHYLNHWNLGKEANWESKCLQGGR